MSELSCQTVRRQTNTSVPSYTHTYRTVQCTENDISVVKNPFDVKLGVYVCTVFMLKHDSIPIGRFFHKFFGIFFLMPFK